MTSINQQLEAYEVSMMSDLQLIEYFWCRDLTYPEYLAFVQKHNRPAVTEQEFNDACQSAQARMDAYFKDN
jgi:hypothetical protein